MSNELTLFSRELTGVYLRREMVKNRAIIESLDPVERTIFVASCDQPIRMFGPEERMVKVREILTGVLRDAGAKAPDEADFRYLIVRLSEITKEYYGDLTWREFKLAFTLGMTGQLDDYLQKRSDGTADRGHYHNFNVEFVCKIVGAYKSKRGYVLAKANDMVRRPREAMTDGEAKMYRNSTIAGLIEAYENYRQTGRLDGVGPIAEMLYYNLLSDVGLAPALDVTEAERVAVFNKVVNGLAKSGLVADRKRLESEGPNSQEIQGKVMMAARKKALLGAFDSMAQRGVKIVDYIKFV